MDSNRRRNRSCDPKNKMERSLYRYILRYSKRDQIILVLWTAASMPLIYLSLEIPKLIINRAIGGQDIPQQILGIPIDQIRYLIALCCAFLGLVILNGGVKYYLNVYRGIIGERMLRRFRYELYTRVLRFPLPHFKRTSAGEIIPMITAETEPLGGFIADSFALPAMQGGLLITYLFFIFNQDVYLGAAATALYPFQLWLIPKLQRKVNLLAKDRVLTVRKLADRIGESVGGVTEIHAHATSKYERADIGARLGRIYDIRFDLYKRKFFIKFLNNFLAQITPFFFYLVGGYFVIQGDLTIGALVAVLAAYKDLSGPWAELLKYYQMKEDVRVKHAQIIEQFQPPNLIDEDLLNGDANDIDRLTGELVASNLAYAEDEHVKALDGANFQMPFDGHMAVVGVAGSGKDEIARLTARLLFPTGGRVSVGGKNLTELSETVVDRQISYVGQSAYVFAGSVRSNLVYGLKHLPVSEPQYDEAQRKRREQELKRARESGNSLHDIGADWIDYSAAGVESPEALEERIIETLTIVDMDEDVYQLGLRSTVDPEHQRELADRILKARTEMLRQLDVEDGAKLVEPFNKDRYNTSATAAENLLFGTPRGGVLDVDQLAIHPYVQRVLAETGLLDDMVEIGRHVAETMIDLFADLPPGHEFFEQFSFISAEELPEFQGMLARIANQGMGSLTDVERSRLLSLALKLAPARHRLGLLDEAIQTRILSARRLFADELPEELRPMIAFFDAERYNSAATIQDNILFGKRVFGQANAQARLNRMLANTVDELGLRRDIIREGLEYEGGIAGGRLAPGLRQKLAIARCLLKRPDLLVIHEATGALDTAAERRVLQRIREHMESRGILWILSRISMAQEFGQILVVDDGKVVEKGSFDELNREGSIFYRLLNAH